MLLLLLHRFCVQGSSSPGGLNLASFGVLALKNRRRWAVSSTRDRGRSAAMDVIVVVIITVIVVVIAVIMGGIVQGVLVKMKAILWVYKEILEFELVR